jgi:hypothetical protein
LQRWGEEMSRPKFRRYALQALVLGFLFMMPAAAWPAEPTGQRPCMEELEKFCSEVQAGEGRLIHCLQEHEAQLSPVCRDEVQSIMKRLEEAKQACTPDIEKFCSDVTPGGGRLIRCLAPHYDELTPACREKGGPLLKRAAQAKKSPS